MNIEEIKQKILSNAYYYSHHAEIERKAEDLTFAQIEQAIVSGRILEHYPDTGRGESCEENEMRKAKCNFCDSDRYEERKIEYLYSHQGQYLLVPNTPVEVCLNCGMIYYDAAVMKEIERRFLAIQQKSEEPDRYVSVPAKDYA